MDNRALHVVAAAIVNQQHVLITRRAMTAHQGGKWEFPGGKVEPGELPIEALKRELQEELGIHPLAYAPLIKIRHHYPELEVLLDVWRVTQFQGMPQGREGQPLKWLAFDTLHEVDFPAANLPIISALQLPPLYLITPEPGDDWPEFLCCLIQALQTHSLSLIRFRATSLASEAYLQCARDVVSLGHRYATRVLIDGASHWVDHLGADGLHLNRRSLNTLCERPLSSRHLLGVSCHDLEEIERANQLGADFALISPIKSTQSHVDVPGLGWEAFERMCDRARMPAFALGGMKPQDIPRAQSCGGQGVAAIRSLWPRIGD